MIKTIISIVAKNPPSIAIALAGVLALTGQTGTAILFLNGLEVTIDEKCLQSNFDFNYLWGGLKHSQTNLILNSAFNMKEVV